jgi:hypothetical protein
MDPAKQILSILESLSIVYPDRHLDERQLELYLLHLCDIPPYVLRAAADFHIQHSPWFPKISELRAAAARLAGTDQFDTLPPVYIDHLLREAVAIEDSFYHEHHLDPAEWHAQSEKFARADRPHRAAYTHEKLARLQAILSEWDNQKPINEFQRLGIE